MCGGGGHALYFKAWEYVEIHVSIYPYKMLIIYGYMGI